MIATMRTSRAVRVASSPSAASPKLVALKALPCRPSVVTRFQDDKKSGIPTITKEDLNKVGGWSVGVPLYGGHA